MEIFVDSWALIPWAFCESINNQKPTPHPGWYAIAFYRIGRNRGLWFITAGMVAWNTVELMLPNVTRSLTLSSQRAETKDYITVKANALVSGEYTDPRVSNELGLADYTLSRDDLKRNRTRMDECPWEKKSISSHRNHHTLCD